MLLEGEIALVTGGSRGIGRAIAEELGRQGATVVATATSESGAEAISQYLKEAGIQGRGMVLNVCDGAVVESVVKTIGEEYGPVSILVNNAGITRDSLFMVMKEDQWDDIIQTNLSSLYRTTKACLRPMIKARKGRIINIASVVALTGNAGQTNYAAAKAGIIGFSKSLAREIGSRNITVNTVAPGTIDTDMTRELPEKQLQAMASYIPLGRFGHAQEIADAVAFLASSKAAYITGETLNVNGGMYMP